MELVHLAGVIILVAVVLTIGVMLFSSKGEDRIVKEALKQHDPDILIELGQTARTLNSQLPEGAHVEAIHLIVRAENGGVHSIAWKVPEKKH